MVSCRFSVVVVVVIAVHSISGVSIENPVKWMQSNFIKTLGKLQIIRFGALNLTWSDSLDNYRRIG